MTPSVLTVQTSWDSGCDGNAEGIGPRRETGIAGRGRAGIGGGGEVGGEVAGAWGVTDGFCPAGELERGAGLFLAGLAFSVVALAVPAFDGVGLAAGRSEAGRALTPWR